MINVTEVAVNFGSFFVEAFFVAFVDAFPQIVVSLFLISGYYLFFKKNLHKNLKECKKFRIGRDKGWET